MRISRTQQFTLLTIALTALSTAGPSMWTTWVQNRTQVQLAREHDAIERREHRKATVREFVNACSALAVGLYQAAQAPTVDSMQTAFAGLPTKNAAYLVAFAASSADFPEVTGDELPKDSIVGPAGPIESITAETMPALRASLLRKAKELNDSCEKFGNRLLIGLRGEHSTMYAEEHGE